MKKKHYILNVAVLESLQATVMKIVHFRVSHLKKTGRSHITTPRAVALNIALTRSLMGSDATNFLYKAFSLIFSFAKEM
jgi:hypothetical protein